MATHVGPGTRRPATGASLARVALAGLVLLLGSRPAAATEGADVQAAAKAMVQRFADSWNRADGRAYGENYWPEAELVDPSGAIHDGQAAIVRVHQDLWAGAFQGTRASAAIRRIRAVGPTALIVDFDVELSGVRQAPPGVQVPADGVLHAHLKHVMQQRHGQWKVLSAQNTLFTVAAR
jgi:uncharacterized protein (TIGR02246 family)